ncbi:MAG: SH3 domain-containing protein [Halocynthiibacter sp.]
MTRLFGLLIILGGALIYAFSIAPEPTIEAKPPIERPKTISWAQKASSTVPQNSATVIIKAVSKNGTQHEYNTHNASTAALTPYPTENIRYIHANRVNLRSGPSTTHAVVTKLMRGDKAHLISTTNDWAEIIDIETDTHGYLSLKFISEQKPS